MSESITVRSEEQNKEYTVNITGNSINIRDSSDNMDYTMELMPEMGTSDRAPPSLADSNDEVAEEITEPEEVKNKEIDEEFIASSSHHAFDTWVRKYAENHTMELDPNFEPVATGYIVSPHLQEKVVKNMTFERVTSSGFRNHCLIYSIFNSLSITFRQLSNDNRNKITDYFRKTIFRMLLEKERDQPRPRSNRSDTNSNAYKTQLSSLITDVKGNVFLSEDHLKFLGLHYHFASLLIRAIDAAWYELYESPSNVLILMANITDNKVMSDKEVQNRVNKKTGTGLHFEAVRGVEQGNNSYIFKVSDLKNMHPAAASAAPSDPSEPSEPSAASAASTAPEPKKGGQRTIKRNRKLTKLTKLYKKVKTMRRRH